MSTSNKSTTQGPLHTFSRGTRTTQEAAKRQIDLAMDITSAPDALFRHTTTTDLKKCLDSCFPPKKGFETIFVKELCRMYALTRTITSIGFPKRQFQPNVILMKFKECRKGLLMQRAHESDRFQNATFNKDPGGRKKALSMQMGILMGVLESFDSWYADVKKWVLDSNAAGLQVAFTLEQLAQLDQFYDDVYYVSKGLLGDVATRVDLEMDKPRNCEEILQDIECEQ